MVQRARSGRQLAIELPPELLQRLKAQAATEERPVAALVRRWIEAGLAAEPSGGDASGLAASLEELRGDVELGSARLSRCINGQAELLQRIGALERVGSAGPAAAGDLVERLEALEAAVAALQQQQRRPARTPKPAPVASLPLELHPPDEGSGEPRTGEPAIPLLEEVPAGALTTAELAERTKTNRAAWNNWARDKRPGAVRKMPAEVGDWRLAGKAPAPGGGPDRWLWEPA